MVWLLHLRGLHNRTTLGNPSVVTQGRRGARAATEHEEREFRRRAAALNIRISPYFKRSRPAPA